MSEICTVVTTCGSEETALTIAAALVDQAYAACVNILPPMTSVYFWEGKREEAGEVAALIKTRRSLADKAVAAAWENHPYSVPCFVVLPGCWRKALVVKSWLPTLKSRCTATLLATWRCFQRLLSS